jgi:hypothetical protein
VTSGASSRWAPATVLHSYRTGITHVGAPYEAQPSPTAFRSSARSGRSENFSDASMPSAIFSIKSSPSTISYLSCQRWMCGYVEPK